MFWVISGVFSLVLAANLWVWSHTSEGESLRVRFRWIGAVWWVSQTCFWAACACSPPCHSDCRSDWSRCASPACCYDGIYNNECVGLIILGRMCDRMRYGIWNVRCFNYHTVFFIFYFYTSAWFAAFDRTVFIEYSHFDDFVLVRNMKQTNQTL